MLNHVLYSKNITIKTCKESYTELIFPIFFGRGDEYRPAFKQLGEITCALPSVAHLALTATATNLSKLTSTLMYIDPKIVSANPDRPNIFIDVQKRLPNKRKFDKFGELIDPIANELNQKLSTFPVTIVYIENLSALGYCYQYVSHCLNSMQYDGDGTPENRIFIQYHKDYKVCVTNNTQ